jgi:hypothetical protein
MNFLAAEDINQSDIPVDPGLGKWQFQKAMVVNQ